MRRVVVIVSACVVSASFISCGGGASPTTPSAPIAVATPAPPRVVVISVDGLRPDALAQTPAPNIRGVAERGAYSWAAQTINPSNTLPSHVSMLSGYPPSVHKVTWDDYLPQRGSITVATIFTATRAAGRRSVMIAGKEKLNHFRDTGKVDTYVLATRGDDDIANEAIVQATTSFDLMFVHFPNVDLIGHARGWMSAAFLAQVSYTDGAVGRVLKGLPPQTTVIVTADHGGHDFGHGTTDPRDTTIPWMIAGATVKSGLLTTRVSTMDTAATVAYVLGLSLPADVAGRAVAESFEPRPGSTSAR